MAGSRRAICGSRPAGIYTAGTAQRLINIEGQMPGKKCVVLGSGDIGLIMARRMTLEGAKVEAVLEILPKSGGLPRNIEQCLHDYDIPLLLNHTVVKIHGNDRVEGVTMAKVDKYLQPIANSKKFIACDTLLLSVGLIPENEISRQAGVKIDPKTQGPVIDELCQTSVDGIFACGNVAKVHDLVDNVSEQGALAGKGVVEYLRRQHHG
jgi:thioredoxin reductase